VLWFLLVLLLGFATFFGVLGLAIDGAFCVVIGAHSWLRKRQPCLPCLAKGGIELLLASLLSWTPFAAADHAERSNDWIDVDSNGMADPMVNGSYDWVDVNGGDFGRTWAMLTAVMGTPAALALYALSKRSDPSHAQPVRSDRN
jgi:hypothetical protein